MRNLIIVFSLFISSISISQTYKVEKFGAKADGKTNNTSAIQKTIDFCNKNGGGQVELSKGVYLSGTLELKSNVVLNIYPNATLKAIADSTAFKYIQSSVISRVDFLPWRAFIYADSQENISICGGGTIDGSGEQACFQNNKFDTPSRPYGLHLINSTNVVVENLNMRNSAFWMQRYFNCTNVRITRVNVFNHANLNNDGIDIDSSNDVVVADCIFDSDDDAICIKSEGNNPAKNIVISNCIASSFCSAVKLGTGSVGGFENIIISNIVIRRSKSKIIYSHRKVWGGIHGIEVLTTDGGRLRQVMISNITMEDVLTPIHIRLGNRMGGRTPKFNKTLEGRDSIPQFILEDVTISNVMAYNVGPSPVTVAGFEDHPIKRLTLKDITIHCGTPGEERDITTAPKWIANKYPTRYMYGTNLPVFGLITNYTIGLKVENFRVFPAKGEEREMEQHLNKMD